MASLPGRFTLLKDLLCSHSLAYIIERQLLPAYRVPPQRRLRNVRLGIGYQILHLGT